MKRLAVILMIGAFSACQKSAAPSGEAQTCPVAKVSVSTLEAPLRGLIFARTENRELKERFEAQESKQREKTLEMMEEYKSLQKNGKFEVDLKKQLANPDFEEYRLVTETVQSLVKKELAGVIQNLFKDKYTVVIEQNFGDNIVYAKCQVPDITNDVREFLVRGNPAK